jgi:hypothetical protein
MKTIEQLVYIIEMTDGTMWEIPAKVIAENRANYYKHEFGDSLEKSLKEDTIPLFLQDNYEIRDWASNNMNWSDVKAFARRKELKQKDYDNDDAWVNGAYRIETHK